MKHEFEVKIKKLEEKTITTEDITSETQYVLIAENSLGLPRIRITSEDPFEGLEIGATIKVVLNNPQTKL